MLHAKTDARTPDAMIAPVELRPARSDDARDLAQLANIAGDGFPLYVWGQLADPRESAMDAGVARAGRTEGSFSYTNAVVAQIGGRVAGCVVGYPLAERLPPIPADMPAMSRPLQALENRVASSLYVNFLAVYPDDRHRGIATQLIAAAAAKARAVRARDLTLIAADANATGLAFYAALGFREIGREVMVKEGWIGHGRNWALLSRPVAAAESG